MASRTVEDPAGTGSGPVVLGGTAPGVADVARPADRAARPVPRTGATQRMTGSWVAARQNAAAGRVHGRATGVGAGRNEDARPATLYSPGASGNRPVSPRPPPGRHCVPVPRTVSSSAAGPVAAVRAPRRRLPRSGPGLPAGRALEPAEAVLDAEQAGRPLTDDVRAAAGLLGRFTDIWRGSGA
ncbi:hypothetical protein QF030_003649 [Streptomyces rishiriensis]|uniref:Uncharacterized protein n=1 Tax=Streptomyces rishiriensis TaxID=68264 RepID=A0ABU0NQU3_STRRH|nr:hypothetical protein [Streptomyces rishiriensis]